MSVESISKVLNADLDVSPTAKLVLVGIANHDGDGGAWPSVKTLARYAGVSARSVQYALSDLEAKGLIVRHINEGGTARTKDHSRPNLYEITLSGGEASCTPPGEASVTPPVKPVAPEPSLNASIEPSPENLVPSQAEVVPLFDVFFEHFWNAYPRKVGKPAARRAMKAKFALDTRMDIVDGFEAWNTYWNEAEIAESFIPHPATWLNQERYNDTPPKLVPYSAHMSRAEEAIEKIRNRDQ